MITLIVGTNRPGSNTRKVARHLEEIYAGLKVPLNVLDLAQLPSEIFAPSKFPESFEKRPVCFVGVAAWIWGALRPVEQLQAIFGYRNAFVFPERVVLPQINGLLDESGRLKDPELLQRLKNQVEGFVDFVERLQKIKLRG
ncbi:MAG: NADPH-dependent oxidoreductase [Verrucomicrobia bacterium]|nr:NADPH-dependent oxidoreductase [Verrucomicrobiota bacterium]